LLLKNDFSPKAIAKLMGHASEIITIDVYGDKRQIIADCVEELQPFIDEVLPADEMEDELDIAKMDILIPVENYMEWDAVGA